MLLDIRYVFGRSVVTARVIMILSIWTHLLGALFLTVGSASAYFKSEGELEKMRYVQHNVVPTPSKIVRKLGSPLAQVLFDSLRQEERVMIGLTPNLNGPGEDLWVSPNDSLMGEVKLTPPLTTTHKQALTHRRIVELGEILMKEYAKTVNEEKQQAVEEAVKTARKSAKLKCEEQLKIAIRNEKEKCAFETEKIMEENEQRIQEHVHMTMEKMKQLFLLHMLQQRKQLIMEFLMREKELQKKQQVIEVEPPSTSVSEEVERKINCTIRKTNFLLKHQWRKMSETLQKYIKKVEETMQSAQYELEQQKMREINYARREERETCQEEKYELVSKHMLQLKKINNQSSYHENQIHTLEMKLKVSLYENQYWKSKTKLLLEEFQRFITFVHGSTVYQSEYMLSINKLINEELKFLVSKFNVARLDFVRNVNVQATPDTKDIGQITEEKEVTKTDIPRKEMSIEMVLQEEIKHISKLLTDSEKVDSTKSEIHIDDDDDEIAKQMIQKDMLLLEAALQEMKGTRETDITEKSTEKEVETLSPEKVYEIFIDLQKEEPDKQERRNRRIEELISNLTYPEVSDTIENEPELISVMFETETKKSDLTKDSTDMCKGLLNGVMMKSTSSDSKETVTSLNVKETEPIPPERVNKIVKILQEHPSLAKLFSFSHSVE